MQKKLTLSIEAEIYEALHKMAGKRKIGRFIETLVRPHIASLDEQVDGLVETRPGSKSSIPPWAAAQAAPAEEEGY